MTREPPTDPEFDPAVAERQRHWQGRLGRLRLGAEPLEEQLARYRRVTLALTVIPLGIGLMFLGLFFAFGRPDIGAGVVGVFVLPIIVVAWIDYVWLHHRASAYLREQRTAHPSPSETSPGRST